MAQLHGHVPCKEIETGSKRTIWQPQGESSHNPMPQQKALIWLCMNTAHTKVHLLEWCQELLWPNHSHGHSPLPMLLRSTQSCSAEHSHYNPWNATSHKVKLWQFDQIPGPLTVGNTHCWHWSRQWSWATNIGHGQLTVPRISSDGYLHYLLTQMSSDRVWLHWQHQLLHHFPK